MVRTLSAYAAEAEAEAEDAFMSQNYTQFNNIHLYSLNAYVPDYYFIFTPTAEKK